MGRTFTDMSIMGIGRACWATADPEVDAGGEVRLTGVLHRR